MKQRQLTQEELDLAPEWATDYFIDNEGDVCFESESYYQYLVEGKLLDKQYQTGFGMEEDSQPIPRKAFDVANHRFSVVSLINSVVVDNDVATLFFEFDKRMDLTKSDSIAIAKALGVTTEDLNTHPTS